MSFSKDENINKNVLLILKQEKKMILKKNELKKTKEKVDILENKIESINDDGNLNKKNIIINKEKIKYSGILNIIKVIIIANIVIIKKLKLNKYKEKIL